METHRCFDCFHDFAPDEPRFAVLKKMRDLDDECPNGDRAIYESLTYDKVFVCADCAGWYGDHPIPLTAEEANR
jgi:hypothetical protein